MYRPNFAWRVVSPYPTHVGGAAMPECGWLRKREYSNLRDRERVLLILNGSTSLSFVSVIERGFSFQKLKSAIIELTFNAMKQKAY